MAHQTSVNSGNGRAEAPATVIAQNLGDCARDVVELGDLQIRLLQADLKQSMRQAILPAVSCALALAFGMACFPVLLMAIAYLFVELAQWSFAASFFAATGIGLLIAGLLGAVAWWAVRRITGLERSKKELTENVRWLKEALSTSGRVRHRTQCATPARSSQ
jgi:hypothetical protein